MYKCWFRNICRWQHVKQYLLVDTVRTQIVNIDIKTGQGNDIKLACERLAHRQHKVQLKGHLQIPALFPSMSPNYIFSIKRVCFHLSKTKPMLHIKGFYGHHFISGFSIVRGLKVFPRGLRFLRTLLGRITEGTDSHLTSPVCNLWSVSTTNMSNEFLIAASSKMLPFGG